MAPIRWRDPLARNRRLSVAPMMDWTDRHCRMFHRQFSAHALLYTEMMTAAALVRGGADHLLVHDARERPLALQLGGSEPAMLAGAVRIARPLGFAEVNLNVGCPSDRVQSGTFGACLMRRPELVADCARAMIEAAGEGGPMVTVKCRIGVDGQDPEEALPAFVDAVAAAGVRHVVVHARKAWLEGLSPKENRTVPPLDYPLVARLRDARPELAIALNGGIGDVASVRRHLADGFAGVMVGRAAYHDPAALLGPADAIVTGRGDRPAVEPEQAVRGLYPYIEDRLAEGVPLNRITRHMLGAFNGRPGARAWRRCLSEGAHRPGAGVRLIEQALGEVSPAAGTSYAQAAE
ncbi:MAG TPA: tRNA dihydrouridine(20/20a) synthase DusA [Thermohalobaculum sp.]|nr:tRNA dihydrouridine(20/20a) synthase DusA [Thermohalobaculum sp.]